MLGDGDIPEIQTFYDYPSDSSVSLLYTDIIKKTLRRVLPPDFFFSSEKKKETAMRKRLSSLLPLLQCSEPGLFPFNMSFFLLSKYRQNAFKFFFDMISNWLVPGKRLNVVSFYAVDFAIPEMGRDVYTLCEVMIRIENEQELEAIQRNYPIIESEIRLGVASRHYARRVLEVKGLAADEKVAMMHEHVAYLLNRMPQHFDYDIFTEMQHVLVMSRDEFKAARECRHLSRIICIQYLFRKDLRQRMKTSPNRRYLNLKLFKAKIGTAPEKKRHVLALLVAVNFLRDKEILEEKHLLKAVKNYIPKTMVVEGSFFANRRGSESICTLYLEVEKESQESFTAAEMRRLQRLLPRHLKGRIQHLMQPVFMPHNEEEIMRNILSLSTQVKYLRDIPQVIISFDEQTVTSLVFLIVLVRVTKPGTRSVQEMFQSSKTCLEYLHDRCKTIGMLRKKYPKEAAVFRVKLSKEQFLRDDHSIDLFRARHVVVSELGKVMGEVRDFNGSMISKQSELLREVRNLIVDVGGDNELLLEKLFYSITPIVMRNLLDPQSLKTLFLMLLEGLGQGLKEGGHFLRIQETPQAVYVMVVASHFSLKEEVAKKVSGLKISSNHLAMAFVNAYETPCLGYIYQSQDPAKQQEFRDAIQKACETWSERAVTPTS